MRKTCSSRSDRFAASDKRGVSACTLAGKLDQSYETAWYMLARIRKAMDHRESLYMLADIAELDASNFGAEIPGKGATQLETKAGSSACPKTTGIVRGI